MLLLPLLVTFLGTLCEGAALARRAVLTQVSNFGNNPAGLKMYVYVPNNLAASPGVIVTLHGASGNGQQAFISTPYAKLAEQYGFIVVYPESPQGAWDASSRQSAVRDGGGASQSIATMARYIINTYKADANKVFVSGISSGGSMTNTMAGTYPDVFKAVIIYSASGTANIRNMYPNYTGSYPKIQTYLGSEDRVISASSFNATLTNWAGVFGYDTIPDQVLINTPQSRWTTYVLGSKLRGVWAQGTGHPVFVLGEEDMKWFGFAS